MMELFEVCPCGTPLKSLTDPIGICPECYVWRRAFVPETPVPVLDPGWDKVEKD